MYRILTIINIVASLVTLYCLVLVVLRYELNPRMKVFGYMGILSMLALCAWQVYNLTYQPKQGEWVYKLPIAWWWVKTLYWSWAVRFSAIKKNSFSVIKKSTI